MRTVVPTAVLHRLGYAGLVTRKTVETYADQSGVHVRHATKGWRHHSWRRLTSLGVTVSGA